ncbi:hypothetical protein G3A39_38750 [Paraburkholderia aspalathi]|nr:hypothetical protein [Paraburkholderia aspalathi]
MRKDVCTINELVDRYADDLWKTGGHKNNAIMFLREIAEINRHFFSNIDIADIYEIVEGLKARNNKNSTINHKVNALTKLLRRAQEDGLLPNVPRYKRLEEPAEKSFRYLTQNEEHALIDSIRKKSPLLGLSLCFSWIRG